MPKIMFCREFRKIWNLQSLIDWLLTRSAPFGWPILPHYKMTPKQALFAELYVRTGDATRAYRMAYNVRKNTKPKSVWESASKLRKNPKVASRIEEIMDENRLRLDATVGHVTEKLEEAYELALSTHRPRTAITAAMHIAELHGLIGKKKPWPLMTICRLRCCASNVRILSPTCVVPALSAGRWTGATL